MQQLNRNTSVLFRKKNAINTNTKNSEGLISWILITDRIIYEDSETDNITTIEVSYNDFTFNNNPRNVSMENSHRERFQSNEEITEFNSLIIPIISLIAVFFTFRKLKKEAFK